MTKNTDVSNQEKIAQKKEEFLKELKTDELEILDETSGGRAQEIAPGEGNNWCDQGC